MTTKLIQKDLLRGTQEFEIVDEQINVRIRAPFRKEETLSVMLTVLNPEPVISNSRLHFTSRVNSEPLISLYLEKPNANEFNAFVANIKQRAMEEFHAFAGLKPAAESPSLGDNVYDEPPEFDDSDSLSINKKTVDAKAIEGTIELLKQNLDADSINDLVTALNDLKADTQNESLHVQVVNAFNALGPLQGAVLTYAPYMSILLADDPFGGM